VRTLYERGGDYIDAFGPLVLSVLASADDALSVDAIHGKVAHSFGLDIPGHSLETIVTRLSRRSLVRRSHSRAR
jgi:hypothetical protein